jgi:hypothetical protein
LNLFRSVRQHTLALIQPLSQAQLGYSPGAGRWSVGEVADHVVLAHALILEDIAELIRLKRAGRPAVITRTFANMDAAPACIPRFFLPMLEIPFSISSVLVPQSIRISLIRQRWIPFRAASQAVPSKGKLANHLRLELIGSLRETESLFAGNSSLDFSDTLHSHPLLGRNDVLGLLRLSASHEQRHQSQIEDTLKALGPQP